MSSKLKSSATMRIIVIGVMSFVLMVPAIMIQYLVHDREMARDAAASEVSQKWGDRQLLAGPILTVPIRKQITDNRNWTTSTCKRYAHFLPDTLSINGSVTPHIRSRGIYDIALYNGKLQVTGSFSLPQFEGMGLDGEEILWDEASLAVGITDMKGIKETIKINWNGAAVEATPGIESNDIIASGVSAPVALDGAVKKYPFSFALDLNGSRELRFLPLGKDTAVMLTSPWPAPSFQGAFLPEKRDVTDHGFTAAWRTLQVNRNYPQRWIGKQKDISASAFGVDFFSPVSRYQMTERSLKYSILFIGLTFTAYFVIELLSGKALHPIQYLLIGLALVLFYTLLLSLSEHIGFTYSYLAAATGTIVLITAYTAGVLSHKGISLVIASLLSVLYAFLFVILQMEDYALLLGSFGLFIILGTVMFLTRKVDWSSAMRPEEAVDGM